MGDTLRVTLKGCRAIWPGTPFSCGLSGLASTIPCMGDEDYQAALSGEPTELAPSSDGTSAHTAWALDDGPEWRPPFWTAGRIVAVVSGVAVVAAVVAAGVAGYYLRPEPETPAAQTPVPAAPLAPAPPPAAPTGPREGGWVGVTEPTTAMTHTGYSDAELRRFDEKFLSQLRDAGWVVTDPVFLARVAKGICVEYARGSSVASVMQSLGARYSAGDAKVLASVAQVSYPDCVASS